jgi:hypothetical protein
MAVAQVTAGNRIITTDLNAYYNLLKGAAGEGITLVYNAAGALSLQPSSDPAASTQLIQVKNNAGTVKFAVRADGALVFSDATVQSTAAGAFADGTVGAPGAYFNSETSTGLYRLGAGRVGVAATGVAVAELSNASTAFLALGVNHAAIGVIRIPNAAQIVSRNAGNSSDQSLITYDASDHVTLASGGAAWGVGTATTALGGGAAPTLGTIGGSGPATAGQNSWLAVYIAGTLSYLPVWR